MNNNHQDRPYVIWKDGKPTVVDPTKKSAPLKRTNTQIRQPAQRQSVNTRRYEYTKRRPVSTNFTGERRTSIVLISAILAILLVGIVLVNALSGIGAGRAWDGQIEYPSPEMSPLSSDGANAVSALDTDGLVNTTVFIDPGHGFHDAGAVDEANGVMEKDIVLKLSLLLRNKLEANGVTVFMSRDSDEAPKNAHETYKLGLRTRNNMANSISGTALLVSVHIDEYKEDSSVNGIRVYHMADDEPARKLCGVIADEYEEDGIKRPIIKEQKGFNSFQVIRDADMPAILFEAGFMTNPDEVKLMQTDEWAEDVTDTLCDAIVKAFNDKIIGI